MSYLRIAWGDSVQRLHHLAGFAVGRPSIAWLALSFLAAGIGIGCVETAEHAAVALLAPSGARGSAFGILAGVQGFGNLAASAVAGLIWTAVSGSAAFIYLAAWMLLALMASWLPEAVRALHPDAVMSWPAIA